MRESKCKLSRRGRERKCSGAERNGAMGRERESGIRRALGRMRKREGLRNP